MRVERLFDDAFWLDDTFWRGIVTQSTVWLAVGLLLARALARRPDHAHAVLLATVGGATLTPLLTGLARVMGWGLFAAPAAAASVPIDGIVPPLAPNHVAGPSITSIALIVWAALSGVLLLRLIVAAVRGRHLVREASLVRSSDLQRVAADAAARVGLRRTPELRTRRDLVSPLVWCWSMQPVLILPEPSLDRHDRAAWTGIFCHELAHARRRDHWALLFAEIATCLLPWQPLMWWARRRLGQTCELACDRWAVRSGASPVAFAEIILSFVPQRPMRLGLAMSAHGTDVSARIRHLLGTSSFDARPRRTFVSGLIAGLMIASAVTAVAHERPPASRGAAINDGTTPDLRTTSIMFASEDLPSAVIVPAELDLGLVDPGGVGSGTAWLINTTDEPLSLARVKASCGCTTVSGLERGPIPPGAVITFEIQMTAPKEPDASKTKVVTVSIDGQTPMSLPVHLHTRTDAIPNAP